MNPAALRAWLTSLVTSSRADYRHRFLREDAPRRAAALPHLRQYLQEAHADAKAHVRAIAGVSLDPLAAPPPYDPAAGYPDQLHEITLQGYFGEALTGLLAQLYPPFDENWEVPAHLFRFHNVVFEQLELARQNGGRVGRIPGRTGSDSLAFKRSDPTTITCFLNGEAKCTTGHSSSIVADAHSQVGKGNARTPVSMLQVIEILSSRPDQASKDWVEALRKFNLRPTIRPTDRYDFVCYVCGQRPSRRLSWLSTIRPHKKYAGRRNLEVVEVHLDDVRGLITTAYQP